MRWLAHVVGGTAGESILRNDPRARRAHRRADPPLGGLLPGGGLARWGFNALVPGEGVSRAAVFFGASVANVVTILLVILMTCAALLTVAERKWSALIQNRVGANRIKVFGSALGGIPFLAADALKMLTKERSDTRGAGATPLRARAGAGLRAGAGGLRHRAGRPRDRAEPRSPAWWAAWRRARSRRSRSRSPASTPGCSTSSPSPPWPSTGPRWRAGPPTTSWPSSAASAPPRR